MSLKDWQSRLEEHFSEVRKSRPTGRPIFGLEHDLVEKELVELQLAIRAAVKARAVSADMPLPWVAYAAEVGYQYSGDEYWQTFEETTPGWQEYGDRAWIRNCFIKFSEKFDGAVPSGAWAGHFRNICWPIAHAVLPAYLQRQLAELLFDLRLAFRREHLDSPAQLGALLASQSWRTSSRLQLLLDTPLLVGQIASALLLHDQDSSGALITPATLKRIAGDLDREHRAREWLQTAKSRALTVQLSGLRRPASSASAPSSQQHVVRRQAEALGIAPQLIFRPALAQAEWSVSLEIPSFAPLRSRCPEFGPALSGSRCFVAGSAFRAPLAKGRLLYGTQTVPLASWPKSTETLLSFEGAPKELEQLLQAECLLSPGPIWLFRIQADGCGYEIQGKTVRPGQRYIVLSSDPELAIAALGSSLKISCTGAYAVEFNVPAFISREISQVIEKFGLAIHCGIEAWPAGIPAAYWDDEGRAEWVYPDTPRIGIKLDHAVEKLALSLESESEPPALMEIAGGADCSFVEIPNLDPGSYALKVRPTYQDISHRSVEAELQIVIREASRNARESSGRRAPLSVYMDPLQPTVEQLWQGECSIEAAGPRNRTAVGVVELLGSDDGKVLIGQSLPAISLPMTPGAWQQIFNRQVVSNRKVQDVYDSAQSLRITLDGGELGKFTFRADREFAPLRWIAVRRKDGYHLRLLDDSGSSEKAAVSYTSFEAPDKSIKQAEAAKGFDAPEGGGLFFASTSGHRRSIVIPPSQAKITAGGFAAFRLSPKFVERPKSSDGVAGLIQFIEDWSTARVPGHVLAIRWREKVLRELYWHLFYVLCGRAWWDAERHQSDGKAYAEGLFAALESRYKSAGPVLPQLRSGAATWIETPIEKRASKLAGLLQRYKLFHPPKNTSLDLEAVASAQKLADPEWFAEFLFRMATRADTLRTWGGAHYSAALSQALATPETVCIARCIVLTSAGVADERSLEAVSREWQWR